MTELVLLLRWAAANPASASVGGGVLDVNQFPGEEDSKVVGFFFSKKCNESHFCFCSTEVVALTDRVLGFDERLKKKAEELKEIFSQFPTLEEDKKEEDAGEEEAGAEPAAEGGADGGGEGGEGAGGDGGGDAMEEALEELAA